MATRPAAVDRALARRATTAANRQARIIWFIDNVLHTVETTLKQRMHIATEYTKNKIVHNLSVPVGRTKGPRGRDKETGRFVEGNTRVTQRSKPGEFPRADTTQLMKTVFGYVEDHGNGIIEGYVGTPLEYGLILETKMDRSFLLRTVIEESSMIARILTVPKIGGS